MPRSNLVALRHPYRKINAARIFKTCLWTSRACVYIFSACGAPRNISPKDHPSSTCPLPQPGNAWWSTKFQWFQNHFTKFRGSEISPRSVFDALGFRFGRKQVYWVAQLTTETIFSKVTLPACSWTENWVTAKLSLKKKIPNRKTTPVIFLRRLNCFSASFNDSFLNKLPQGCTRTWVGVMCNVVKLSRIMLSFSDIHNRLSKLVLTGLYTALFKSISWPKYGANAFCFDIFRTGRKRKGR